MRVLHVNGNYIGSALHQTMVEHLNNENIESTIVVPSNGKEQVSFRLNSNVCVMNCYDNLDRFFFFHKQKKISNAIEKSVCVEEYNCLHAYTMFTDGYTTMKLAEKYRKPYVVAVRNTDLNIFMKYMPWLRCVGLDVMQAASKIYFLSEAYKKELFEKYVPPKLKKLLEPKCLIVPNGIDDFWFQNKMKVSENKDFIKSKKIRLVYVGRIDHNKNILTTQKAINILKKRGYEVEYTIVGKIADQKEFNKICFDENTFYVEPKPKEKLIDIYRSNDIFVMPSYTETFGLVYAEAMSQGLPVLYSKGQGFDGQFEEGKVGFAADSHDEQEIAEKLINIINNYSKIKENTVQLVDKFKWKTIVSIYSKNYNSILNKQVRAKYAEKEKSFV